MPRSGFVQWGAPCKGGVFQWVQVPPGELLWPEASVAGMEVKKCRKPLDDGPAGDRTSVQADPTPISGMADMDG